MSSKVEDPATPVARSNSQLTNATCNSCDKWSSNLVDRPAASRCACKMPAKRCSMLSSIVSLSTGRPQHRGRKSAKGELCLEEYSRRLAGDAASEKRAPEVAEGSSGTVSQQRVSRRSKTVRATLLEWQTNK
eukprot:CAMPEP_0183474102 /NCGR_PEP_ID=MMETSP0370-20130417/162533_1 /TAXON_ID=268820 /ORGANISM="Peridinium aciculiferum, Strain PAER-2" /LENGTH=131 /DNA_ID=CAMNT_0025666817 /DNA_START=255 /DNA_END=650 /DNA_ORIENTATION=+